MYIDPRGLIDLDDVMDMAALGDDWDRARTPEAFVRSPEMLAFGDSLKDIHKAPMHIALRYAGWTGGIAVFAAVAKEIDRAAYERNIKVATVVYEMASKLAKCHGARRHRIAMTEVATRLGHDLATALEEHFAKHGEGKAGKLVEIVTNHGTTGVSHSQLLRLSHLPAHEFQTLVEAAIKAQLIERFTVGRGIYYRTKTQPCT